MSDEDMIIDDHEDDTGTPSSFLSSTQQSEVRTLHDVGPAVIIMDEVMIKDEAVIPDQEMFTGDLLHNLGAPFISSASHTYQSELKVEADILQDHPPGRNRREIAEIRVPNTISAVLAEVHGYYCDTTHSEDVGPAVTVMDEVMIKEEAVMPDQEMITSGLHHNLGAPFISSASHTHQPEVKEKADILQETTTVERPCSWITKQVSSRNESYADSNSSDTTTSVPGTLSRGITHKLLQANTKFVEERSIQTYEGTRLEAPVVANWRLSKAEAPEASSERTIVDEESDDDMPFDGISTDDGIDAESDEDGPKHPPYPILEPSRKGHACFYCYKVCSMMDRHLTTCHSSEKDVVRFNAMKKKSKARAEAVTLLTRKGDYYHNLKLLETKSNEPLMVVTNSQTSRRQNNEYGPCPYCLGFFIKVIMCRHIRSCPACSEDLTNQQARKLSTAMLLELKNPSKNEAFIACLRQLRDDHITPVILEDDIIMKCGLQLFESKGPGHSVYVRRKMRQLGRLLCALREISTNTPDAEAPLRDFVNPEKLDLVVTAVRNVCGAFSFDGRIEQTKPGLALHLGHSLRKCARLVMGMGIRLYDKKMTKRAKGFLNIVEGEWEDKIYGTKLGTLKQQKLNATELLLLAHDLICFNSHLKETMDSLQRRLRMAFSFNFWSELASYTLARLVLYNIRCSVVVSRMLTTDYNKRTWTDRNISQEIAATLTTTEQRVASQQQIIKLVGKKGRVEPIILTAEVAAAMKLILQLRTLHNIQTGNQYFFVYAKGADNTYVKGFEAVTKCVAKANLVNPELLTGSNLRKYTAVVCQLLDLQPAEQMWLIKHLGHSEAVHERYDEVHRNATEMAKVSALLVAVDEGHMEEFADKSLAEIILEEIPFKPQVGPTVSMPLDAPSVITRPDGPSHALSSAQSESHTSTSKFTCGDSDSNEDSEENYCTSNNKKQKCQKWTFFDKAKILEAFRPHTKQGTLPEKSAVIAFLEQNPHMKKKRKWKDVQNFVRNFNVSYKRKNDAAKKS